MVKYAEVFLSKAIRSHGNKYDYSKIEYKSLKTKVIIICKKHGKFEQRPDIHLKGSGCPQCNKITSESFVKKAKEIHYNRYDYSKVDYKGAHDKVIIICPKHGEFRQIPNSHLYGHGCSRCTGGFKRSQEEFISEAQGIHNKYDYSLVKYVNNITKVIIICPAHGEFKQTPKVHLRGGNCQKCVGNLRLTTEQFIKKAKKIHNNEYDYSEVKYVSAHADITITCIAHGDFKQTPHNHLKNKCPKCVNENIRDNLI